MSILSNFVSIEKILDEIISSSKFKELLEKNNLTETDGNSIKNSLKEEIRQGTINENNLQFRLKYLVTQYSKEKDIIKIKCPRCNYEQPETEVCLNCGYNFVNSISEENKNTKKSNQKTKSNKKLCPNCLVCVPKNISICPHCQYDFKSKKSQNLIKCPKCGEKTSKSNKTCPNCGHDFKNKNKKHRSKLDSLSKKFKRNTIFLSMFDFNLKLCPKCGSKLLIEDAFCYNCGLDMVNAENVVEIDGKPKIADFIRFKRETIFLTNYEFNLKTCPNCNSKLLLDDAFCFNCGTQVGEIKETVETPNKEETSKNESVSNFNVLKTNYDPAFKIAYVLYLEQINKNPKKGFSNKLANKYETSIDELKNQAIQDEFIQLESPLVVARNLKITDIKKVLKEHGLKVSGKKEELIERLGENLTDDELEQHFKPSIYLITDNGLEFLYNNNFISYFNKNTEVSECMSPSQYIELFGEKNYSQDEIYSVLINYLNNEFLNQLKQGNWENFKTFSNAIAGILKDQGNLNDAVLMRLKVFLFDINNFSPESGKPNPKEAKLKSKDIYKLGSLIVKMNPSQDELMQLFAQACHEFIFRRVITDEDSWKYLAEILNGEDLKSVSKEINNEYSN